MGATIPPRIRIQLYTDSWPWYQRYNGGEYGRGGFIQFVFSPRARVRVEGSKLRNERLSRKFISCFIKKNIINYLVVKFFLKMLALLACKISPPAKPVAVSASPTSPGVNTSTCLGRGSTQERPHPRNALTPRLNGLNQKADSPRCTASFNRNASREMSYRIRPFLQPRKP